MRLRFLIMAILMTIIVLPVQSTAGEALLALPELEQEALKQNPEILMAEQKAESGQEKKTVASGMPDPMIGYMVQNVGSPGEWTVGKEDMSMQGVVFTQEVPFPGKLGSKGLAAEKDAERLEQVLRETKLRVLNDLRGAYYEYYLADKSAAILTETKDYMKNFQCIAETRYATGQGSQQDVLRAQVEVSMLLDRIAEQEQKREAQTAAINRLTGRDPLAPLGKTAELAMPEFTRSREDLIADALAHSPQLGARQRMIEQSEQELALSKKEFLPDMVLSGGVFSRGDKREVWQASVMFKVPLYFWNKSAGVRAAAADTQAARYDFANARLETIARVRELYSTIKTSEHHVHLYEAGIVPQARLALQSATSNYEVGKTDFLSLLDSENLLLKYQLMQQEELVKLSTYVSLMHELTGSTE